jgi:hypothetical protein
MHSNCVVLGAAYFVLAGLTVEQMKDPKHRRTKHFLSTEPENSAFVEAEVVVGEIVGLGWHREGPAINY